MAGLSGPFDLVVITTGILALPGASPEKRRRSIRPPCRTCCRSTLSARR